MAGVEMSGNRHWAVHVEDLRRHDRAGPTFAASDTPTSDTRPWPRMKKDTKAGRVAVQCGWRGKQCAHSREIISDATVRRRVNGSMAVQVSKPLPCGIMTWDYPVAALVQV